MLQDNNSTIVNPIKKQIVYLIKQCYIIVNWSSAAVSISPGVVNVVILLLCPTGG